jgi:hypothetical protein
MSTLGRSCRGQAWSSSRPDGEEESGPYDIVVDLVGGDNYLTRVTWLRRHGTLLMVGFLAPPPAAVSPLWLGALMLNRCRLIGTTIRGRTNGEKALLAREMRKALPLLAEGRLRVHVGSLLTGQVRRGLCTPGRTRKIRQDHTDHYVKPSACLGDPALGMPSEQTSYDPAERRHA